MRYLILANNSGGLYRFRKELIQQLIKDENEIYAVTPFDVSIEELRQLGISLIDQSMNRRGINLLQEVRLFLNYCRIIKKVKPDMIITYTIKPGIYGGIVSRWMKIPYVVNVTGLGSAFQKSGFLRMIIVALWKVSLKSARCIFFENEENAKVFEDLSIVERKRVHVLHGSGVNVDNFPFAEYPVSDAQMHFLFIGRVMHEKGIDELLAAIEKLHYKYSNIILDIVGWCEEDYEARFQDLQERGLIHFHGFQIDVNPFIEKAHAFVLPSYHEGMANTLLEAAAMGRPLITSNIHGCMEAVVDGETGFLCEPRNTESLVGQMEKFINLTYEQKCEMGRKSHEYVVKYFDKRKVVKETVETLYGILEE